MTYAVASEASSIVPLKTCYATMYYLYANATSSAVNNEILYVVDADSYNNMNNIIINGIKITSGDNNVKQIKLLDDPLHNIIDYRSVLYLFLLQILLYNQQYAYDDNNDKLNAIGANNNVRKSANVLMMP